MYRNYISIKQVFACMADMEREEKRVEIKWVPLKCIPKLE